MLLTYIDRETDILRITLRPNGSLLWKGSLYLIISLSVLALVIAGTFFYYGATLILPFSGLELALLTGSLYYLWLKNLHPK